MAHARRVSVQPRKALTLESMAISNSGHRESVLLRTNTLLPPLSKVVGKDATAITTKRIKYNTPQAPVDGSGQLREMAWSHAHRRHTVIQYQLTAARLETVGAVGSRQQDHQDGPPDGSLAAATMWEKYIKTNGDPKTCKPRRPLAKQLDALGLYMEERRHHSSCRAGPGSSLTRLPCAGALKELRTSELHRFEVLRRTTTRGGGASQGHGRTSAVARRVSIAPTAMLSLAACQPHSANPAEACLVPPHRASGSMLTGFRRRRSVRFLPKLGTA